MARKSTGPKWYESKGAFFATVAGTTHNLGSELEAATEKWSELMKRAKGDAVGDYEPVVNLLTRFLAHIQVNRKPATYEAYAEKFRLFIETEGGLMAAMLRPRHMTEWCDKMRQPRGVRGYKWGSGSARMFISAIKAAYEWGTKQGYLSANPIAQLQRLDATQRGDDCLVTEEQHRLLVSQASPAMADLLDVLWHTGSRPKALCLVEARDLQGTRAVMQGRPGIKLKKIVLYFNKKAMEVVTRRAAEYLEGPIFRAERGDVWTKNALYPAMDLLRTRCGCGHVTPYSYRHAYAHRALRAGVPIAQLAKVMNTSVMYLERVYGHLHTATDVLQNVVESI